MFNLQIIFNHMQRLNEDKLAQSQHYERSRKTKSTSFHLNLKDYTKGGLNIRTPKQINIQSLQYNFCCDQQRESQKTQKIIKDTDSKNIQDYSFGFDKPESYRKFPERYSYNPSLLFSKKGSLKETSSTLSNQLQITIPKVNYNGPPTFVKKRMLSQAQELTLQSKKFNFQQSFQIISKVGQGKFGKVYKVKQKATGMIFAMKVIEKQNILQKNLLNQLVRQIKIHMYLRHENIIEMYGVFHDSKNVYVILQFACDGQLYQFMNKQQTPSEIACSFIMKNLLNAVQYLHSKDIFHRDIKPQNIVMVHGTVKLCDFGWAVNNSNKYELRDTFCGTPLYLSPQILSGRKYDYKIDLWAIGIIAYQIIFNASPFQIESRSDLFKIITDDICYPTQSKITPSKDFKSFINKILDKDPSSRMSAQQLTKLPFIVKYSEFETCQELCK